MYMPVCFCFVYIFVCLYSAQDYKTMLTAALLLSIMTVCFINTLIDTIVPGLYFLSIFPW